MGRWIQLKKSKVFTSWNLAPVHRAPSSSPAPPTGRPARVVSRVHRGVQPIRLQPPSSSSFPRGRPDGTPAPAASTPARPAGGQGDGGLEDGPLEARWVSGVPGLSGMMTRLVLDWFAVPRARVHPCTTGPGSGGGQEKKASRCFPCLPPPIKKVPHGGMDGAALQRSKAFHSLRQSFHSSPHLLSSTAQRSAPSSSSSSILHASIHLLYPSIDPSHTIRTKSA